jgi:teichoic acid transport system ATP-binding protein
VSRPDISVRVRDLHLEYDVFSERRAGLATRFSTGKGSGRRVVHALKGVSFDIRQGESVGVLGSNGSGKSTLFLALAGLLPPTRGEILVRSEPKLLGVGAALMPAASGLRNIRLGCLALGMPAEELDAVIEDIVAFTELGEAIERPLKTYSSGMRARLHFAIATAVKPEILLVDEALAVGDKAFRAKSRERIEAMLAAAGTLMLVSHSMNELSRLCRRGIWLEKGVLRADGPIDDVIELYEKTGVSDD